MAFSGKIKAHRADSFSWPVYLRHAWLLGLFIDHINQTNICLTMCLLEMFLLSGQTVNVFIIGKGCTNINKKEKGVLN